MAVTRPRGCRPARRHAPGSQAEEARTGDATGETCDKQRDVRSSQQLGSLGMLMDIRRLMSAWGRRSRIKQSLPGFDAAYYLHWYPDVGERHLDPLRHYLEHGWKEGRDPSAGFSTRGYLAANPDVAASGQNPLLHFINRGFSEGRSGFSKDPRSPVPLPNLEDGSHPRSNKARFETFLELRGNSSVASAVMQGDVNDVYFDLVTGWALGAVRPGAPAELEVYVDRLLVGTTIANLYRPDMDNNEFEHPYRGFRYEFVPPLKNSVDYIITVRRAVDRLIIGQVSLLGQRYHPPTFPLSSR